MSGRHDEIEFDEPTYSECDCCGATTTHLTRFVYRDDATFAVYEAAFSDSPDHDWVSLLVGFGDWGEEGTPADRIAFACRMWLRENSYNVGVIDPEESVWDTEYFGRILARDEALAHPLLQELYDLTDHMVICDRPIIDFLERSASTGKE